MIIIAVRIEGPHLFEYQPCMRKNLHASELVANIESESKRVDNRYSLVSKLKGDLTKSKKKTLML